MMDHCEWVDDGEGNWETSCKQIFTIIEGTPHQNDMKFCCYCGKELREVIREGEYAA